jgi:hypothetical protein
VSASGWFASLALLAALLDAAWPLSTGPIAPARWIELAAFAGLLAGVMRRWRERDGSAWSTPLDGRIVATLAVLLMESVPWQGRAANPGELRLALSAVAAYYALAALVARDGKAMEIVWRAFALGAIVLGLHALWAVTTGLEHLSAAALVADTNWGARSGLTSALLLATLLTLGRALERGAPPAWRLAAVVGALGALMHAASGGLPFDSHALARLEDPLDFSAAMVVALLLHSLGRTAWTLRRERPAEAGRWWGAVAAVTLLGGELLFGAGPGGEGLAVLSVLLACVIAGSPALPAASHPAAAGESAAPLARAA